MFIDFMLDKFRNNLENEAIIWKNKIFSYDWLLNRIMYWNKYIKDNRIARGSVVIIESDFSPNSVALFLSLIENTCILVPLTSTVEAKKPEFIEIAEGEVSISLDENDKATLNKLPYKAKHPYLEKLRKTGHPGLILFSSGSTGKNKASVHDFEPLLEKFKVPWKVH